MKTTKEDIQSFGHPPLVDQQPTTFATYIQNKNKKV
jgi:hypothetical protein